MPNLAPVCSDNAASFVANDNVSSAGSISVCVLIVDDNDDNLALFEAMLRRGPLEIMLASSAEEALVVLGDHEVALVVLDVQMPGMDGYQLATVMRNSSRTRGIPIVFSTAGAEDRSEEFRAHDAGAVEFLPKPVEPKTLRRRVEALVLQARQTSGTSPTSPAIPTSSTSSTSSTTAGWPEGRSSDSASGEGLHEGPEGLPGSSRHVPPRA